MQTSAPLTTYYRALVYPRIYELGQKHKLLRRMQFFSTQKTAETRHNSAAPLSTKSDQSWIQLFSVPLKNLEQKICSQGCQFCLSVDRSEHKLALHIFNISRFFQDLYVIRRCVKMKRSNVNIPTFLSTTCNMSNFKNNTMINYQTDDIFQKEKNSQSSSYIKKCVILNFLCKYFIHCILR